MSHDRAGQTYNPISGIGNVRGRILSYDEMCRIEGTRLQKGMYFRLGGRYSVVLMSARPDAQYRDEVLDNGMALVYEGHDDFHRDRALDPKSVDQPEVFPSGKPTSNGRFYSAAQAFKAGTTPPERVRVYEKLQKGIWSDNGFFDLVDSWREFDGNRNVFRFKLVATDDPEEPRPAHAEAATPSRVIPTSVKVEVWKRDGGRCVMCGARDELHFDHIIPFSKGGTSMRAENIQLLCVRHNLEKRDSIQ